MGTKRGPMRLVTFDIEQRVIPAGYVQAGRYVAICPCGRAVIFRGAVGVIDCAQCGQRYVVEPLNGR